MARYPHHDGVVSGPIHTLLSQPPYAIGLTMNLLHTHIDRLMFHQDSEQGPEAEILLSFNGTIDDEAMVGHVYTHPDPRTGNRYMVIKIRASIHHAPASWIAANMPVRPRTTYLTILRCDIPRDIDREIERGHQEAYRYPGMSSDHHVYYDPATLATHLNAFFTRAQDPALIERRTHLWTMVRYLCQHTPHSLPIGRCTGGYGMTDIRTHAITMVWPDALSMQQWLYPYAIAFSSAAQEWMTQDTLDHIWQDAQGDDTHISEHAYLAARRWCIQHNIPSLPC